MYEIRILGRIVDAREVGKRVEVNIGGIRPGEKQLIPWYLRVTRFPKEGEAAWEAGEDVLLVCRLSSYDKKEGGKGVGLTALYGHRVRVPLPVPEGKDLPLGSAEIRGFGNLASDPDLKYTPTGRAVLSSRIALSDGRGENRKSHFLPLALWGEEAERLADHLRKGDRVAFQGFLQGESWMSREGKRYTLKIELSLLVPLKRSEGGGSPTKDRFDALPEDLPPEEDLPF